MMDEFSELSIRESRTKHVTIVDGKNTSTKFVSTTTSTLHSNSGQDEIQAQTHVNTDTDHFLTIVPENTHDTNADGLRRSASTSSHYDNINASLHARVKAFQEKRAIKRSASVGSNHKNEESQDADRNVERNRNTVNEVAAGIHGDTRQHQEKLAHDRTSNSPADVDRNKNTTALGSGISDKLQSIPNYGKLPRDPLNKPVRNVRFSTGSCEVIQDSGNGGDNDDDTNGQNDNNAINNSHNNSNSNSDNSNDGNNSNSNVDATDNLSNRTEKLRNKVDRAARRSRLDSKPLPPLPVESVSPLRLSDAFTLNKMGYNGVNQTSADFNNYNGDAKIAITSGKKPLGSSSAASNVTTTTTTTTTVTTPSIATESEKMMKKTTTTTTTTTTAAIITDPVLVGDRSSAVHNIGRGDGNSSPLPPHLIADSSAKLARGNAVDPLLANILQLNPSRQAPRRPQVGEPSKSPAPKQSLSSRRGLKLPSGMMQLQPVLKHHTPTGPVPNTNNDKSCNPGSLLNGVQVTSTSSFDTTQRDTEGTTPNFAAGTGAGSGATATAAVAVPGNQFSIFSKYVDIKSGSLNFAGKLSLSSKGIDFDNGSSSHISLEDLEYLGELGRGNYGSVSKVLHKPTHVVMAMKEVRLELDESKFKQILMELEILHKCQSPFIVDFYGAFFVEGAVYMCIEYMDGGSLDKIYSENPALGGIDEPQLAFIATSVISGLKELKDVHNIIHRDVKPTNILCSASQGLVKLCDFGVSGNLVASMAKTNIGCQSYMAPERIKSFNPDSAMYTVQSDVWSLGLSILEMALGKYPYPPETFDNIFSQLSAIVEGPVLKLPRDKFSAEAQEFVSLCLQKRPERRPNYPTLLQHPWLLRYKDVDVNMAAYVTKRLKIRENIIKEKGESSLAQTVPALHKGGLP